MALGSKFYHSLMCYPVGFLSSTDVCLDLEKVFILILGSKCERDIYIKRVLQCLFNNVLKIYPDSYKYRNIYFVSISFRSYNLETP